MDFTLSQKLEAIRLRSMRRPLEGQIEERVASARLHAMEKDLNLIGGVLVDLILMLDRERLAEAADSDGPSTKEA